MTVSLRLSKEDTKLFKSYASLKKISLSELFRTAVMHQIEDEFDIEEYNIVLEEFEKNPVTYSLAEIEKELGLTDV